MWWNPAALSQFKTTQIAGALHIITPSIKFSNDASAAARQPAARRQRRRRRRRELRAEHVLLDADQQRVGVRLGVNAPFGLTTEYDDGWIGRYQALKSQIKTINVNPAISWQVTPTFALGVGVNYQQHRRARSRRTSTTPARSPRPRPRAAQPARSRRRSIPSILAQHRRARQRRRTIKADDGAWGWNIGVAWDATPQLRLAAAYRSEMKFNVEGTSTTTTRRRRTTPARRRRCAGDPGARQRRQQPRSCTAAASPRTSRCRRSPTCRWSTASTPQWEVMADAQWTGWSSIPELTFDPPTPDDSRRAAGMGRHVEDRGGCELSLQRSSGRRASASRSTRRRSPRIPTPRLPDSDRWWFAVGGEYRYSPNWKFDAGFVYIKGDSRELQPEPRQHGDLRPDQRAPTTRACGSSRCRRVYYVLTQRAAGPRARSTARNGRGIPAVAFSGGIRRSAAARRRASRGIAQIAVGRMERRAVRSRLPARAAPGSPVSRP